MEFVKLSGLFRCYDNYYGVSGTVTEVWAIMHVIMGGSLYPLLVPYLICARDLAVLVTKTPTTSRASSTNLAKLCKLIVPQWQHHCIQNRSGFHNTHSLTTQLDTFEIGASNGK